MAALPTYLRDPVGYFGERLRVSRGLDKATGQVTLGYRRIYILPTRAGFGFALVLIAMLLGSMNYSLSLGYILTFLLAGVGLASMLHTFRNLNRLSFEVGRVDPVFAGETIVFHVIARSEKHRHESVWLATDSAGDQTGRSDPVRFSAEPGATTAIRLRVPTRQRGRLRLGRLSVATEYPVGLFHAWSWINLNLHCLVYPKPYPRALPLPPARGQSGAASGAVSGKGADDFSGLREYTPGDSMRHIHWKALARGQGLMTKEFTGLSDSALWLQLEDAPVLDIEEKISVLTRWVVDAHAADEIFGLDLGVERIGPDHGEAHMHRCLDALATYGLKP